MLSLSPIYFTLFSSIHVSVGEAFGFALPSV